MINKIKQLAKRSKWIIITHNIYNNWRTKKQFNLGNFETHYDTIMDRLSLSETLNYIKNVYEDYIRYSSISVEIIRGKRILEIGCGDNLGIALKFLAAGAAQVICLDKFYIKRKSEREYALYKALREQLEDNSKKYFDEAIDLNNGIEINLDKLKYIYGFGIEKARELFDFESFDLIISRAVLEHIYDIESAFSVMNDLLVAGGYMIHKIDFRDHKMFSDSGMHPLTFLTIPEFIYSLMTRDLSRPNRRLISYYRQKMIELRYDAKIFITGIVGKENEFIPHKEKIRFNIDYSKHTIYLINKIRPNLNIAFRNMSNEDLMVSGIFLVAKKPI